MLAIALVFTMTAVGCDDFIFNLDDEEENNNTTAVTRVTLNQTSLSLAVGGSAKLTETGHAPCLTPVPNPFKEDVFLS